MLDQVPPSPQDDDRESLDAEIQHLRQRVTDLELTIEEYRRQINRVITSASWRITSPMRAGATRARSWKMRAKRALKDMGQNRRPLAQESVRTAGLFMPSLDLLPLHSPLRAKVDINALSRPVTADGPTKRPDGEPKVLVVAHVHYPELWADIDDRLARMPVPFDLIVTVTEGAAESVIPTVHWKHPGARIERVRNRGRDWASLITLANSGLLSGYDAIAKVHTKKSEHRIDGDGWRLALLDGIFESPEQILRTIELLKEDRDVGLVVPTGHIAGTEHWGSDLAIVEALASRISMAFDPDELRFPAGSMFWCRPWLLERLADLDIGDDHFELEAGQYDATTAHALERLIGVFCDVAGMEAIETVEVRGRLTSVRKQSLRRPNVYAFYLPQYHQIPENDEFWGEGFTDWSNVAKAKPQFEGHRQPILPSREVGFYDLQKGAVLRRQSQIAKVHGIDGFVFHYYWFDGRQVLQRPINNWLNDKSIDFPLAICWANEPWTRRWDGLETDVLIEQDLTAGWEERFILDVAPFMSDARYIRCDGRPLLFVYRPDLIPDLEGSVHNLQDAARRHGLGGIYLTFIAPSRDFGRISEREMRLSSAVASFPPGSGVFLEPIQPKMPDNAGPPGERFNSYDSAARYSKYMADAPSTVTPFETIFPGWDNSARRHSESYAFVGSNPITFRRWCRRAILSKETARSGVVLVNAWNEWAEGCALEPGRRFGRSLLEAIVDALPERRIHDSQTN